MHPIFEDIKYRGSHAFSDLKYKIQELAAEPKGRIRLAIAGVLSIALIVLVIAQLSRWLGPTPEGPKGVTQARVNEVTPDGWVAKAREALADEPAFADVSIEEIKRKGEVTGVKIRGMVPDMAARLDCMNRLNDLGVPENLDLDLKVDPDSIKP